jgi:hypothetical protein
VTRDARLLAHLEILRQSLRSYLNHLQALWSAPGEPQLDEIERLLVAVGVRAATDGHDAARLLHSSEDGPSLLRRISQRTGLSLGEEALVAAAWWSDADPQVAALLGCAHDDGNRRFPSVGLLRLLLEPRGIELPVGLDDAGPLVGCGLLEPGAGAHGALRPTATARLLLAGGAPTPLPAPRPLPERLAPMVEPLVRHIAAGERGVVLLRGPDGAGRRALAVAAVTATGRLPIGGERPAGELRLVTLLDLAVPVAAGDRAGELGWRPSDPLLIAWGEPGARHPGAYFVDVPGPSHDDRERLWRDALAGHGLQTDLAPALAARFRFTEGDVAAVTARAAGEARWADRSLSPADLWAAARAQPEHALGRLAQLVAPAFTLDDLVVTGKVRDQLDELVAHVALQHVVLDGWGFRRRLPRGQGVAALFAGPPGTGKTMAAEAVAAELDQDLFRIDLSAVVSKYIGETEKNLSAAFDEAERAAAVLFFDEADALFGRRTQVHDAHDRYANLEVDYLLQRVESFTGLVILATNREAAVDSAFVRRLRFTIRFEQPDLALRRELWRRAFPPQALVADLDWDALADIELSGGSIQSAAVAAAYLAAREGVSVGPDHVSRALGRELEKLGRAWYGLETGVTA